MSNKARYKNGIGFLPLLSLLFIGLKLAGIGAVAAWSWWLVLSPIWAPAAFVLTVLLVFAVVIKLTSK